MNMKFPAGQRHNLFFEKRTNVRDSIKRKFRKMRIACLFWEERRAGLSYLYLEDVTLSATDCQWGNMDIFLCKSVIENAGGFVII
jgi:hypothetical protein